MEILFYKKIFITFFHSNKFILLGLVNIKQSLCLGKFIYKYRYDLSCQRLHTQGGYQTFDMIINTSYLLDLNLEYSLFD